VRSPCDISRLVVGWPHLPEHIKAAVMALVGSVGQ
jgi:hypothetical protein